MRQNSGKGGPVGETEADRHAARTACPEKERGAVMVALSSLPTDAEMLVRYGLKLAAGSVPCYAVNVLRRRKGFPAARSGMRRGMDISLNAAERLGARVVLLNENDVASALADFCASHDVRDAVFGASRLSPLRERLRGSLLLEFLYESVGVDVHVINLTPRCLMPCS